MNNFLVCLVTLATFCNCMQFPSRFKKCDKRRNDFNQCLSDVVYEGFKALDKPLKSHGLPSLHYIEFPSDVIIEVGNSTYGLAQKFSKFKSIGLSNPERVTARLEFGPVVSTLTIEASYAEITWQMDYEDQGTTVLLPLNIQTSLDLILGNPTFTFTIELEEYEKGATYFKVIHSDFGMQTDDFTPRFKQLFSDKLLNDEFNSAINEKGVQIFSIYKPLHRYMAPHFGSIFNSFFEKVPVAELFVD
ncbi:uncharacterized protein LOC135138990 [Zophobas morio]|uniref:uncharacterized protein LOC135138990 n=1 Tax=Zophobas morio TaxID=2755281 RepID=UPI003083CCA5